MNRGFRQYFKESFKKSFKLLNNTTNYFKYLLFVIIDLFANVFYFLKPVTDMASIRMTKNIIDGKDVCISNSIITSDKPKSYWNYLLVTFIKAFIFVGIFVIIAALVGVSIYFGNIIGWLIGGSDQITLMIIFAVPATIVLVVFLFIWPYKHISTAYLVDTYPNLNASKQLFSSFESLKRTGKKTLFVNDLVHVLLLFLCYVPLIIILVIFIIFNSNFGYVMQMISILLMVILGFYLIPRILLSHKIVKVLLFEDIVLDDRTLTQKLTGINMDKFASSAKNPLEKRLLSVFDDEEQLNLEAKLFSTIPSIKVLEEKVEEKSIICDEEKVEIKPEIHDEEKVEEKPVIHDEEKVEEKPVIHDEEKTLEVKEEVVVSQIEPVVLESPEVSAERNVLEEKDDESPIVDNTDFINAENPIEKSVKISKVKKVRSVKAEKTKKEKAIGVTKTKLDEDMDDVFEELDEIYLDSDGE